MYAGYIHIEYTYGNPVISEYPFHLPLNVIDVLLGKVAGLADVVIAVEEFQVCEVVSLGCALADDCNRRIFEFTLFDSSCYDYNTLGSAPKRPFI